MTTTSTRTTTTTTLSREDAFFAAQIIWKGDRLFNRFYFRQGWVKFPRKMKKDLLKSGIHRSWVLTRWTPDFD